MNLEQLLYDYPEDLIAVEKSNPSRVMFVDSSHQVQELSKQQLLTKFNSGDLLVINDTKVEKRRVHTESGLEILFIEKVEDRVWQVLFPSSRIKDEQLVALPGGIEFKLLKRGLPQTISLSKSLPEDYFIKFGQMALPPYIQKKRQQRENSPTDELTYQTDWAENEGSCAAPTASLHFNNEDLKQLTQAGVNVCKITLHVGLGTFLPIKEKNILDHKMHKLSLIHI